MSIPNVLVVCCVCLHCRRVLLHSLQCSFILVGTVLDYSDIYFVAAASFVSKTRALLVVCAPV